MNAERYSTVDQSLGQVWCQAQPEVEDAQLAIAHRLGLQYMILQRPAMHNVRYSAAMTVCIV